MERTRLRVRTNGGHRAGRRFPCRLKGIICDRKTRVSIVINCGLRCWFHKCSKLLRVISRIRFETRHKNLRVVRFDHWGAAKRGLQLGAIQRPLCNLPKFGGAIWRVDRFHLYLSTAICMPVQNRGPIRFPRLPDHIRRSRQCGSAADTAGPEPIIPRRYRFHSRKNREGSFGRDH